jgi:uncharacterized protein YecT (DUF1311 family)
VTETDKGLLHTGFIQSLNEMIGNQDKRLNAAFQGILDDLLKHELLRRRKRRWISCRQKCERSSWRCCRSELPLAA